jgi:hypothetical protein
MDKTVQKKENEKPTLSPLAKDKTYGERMYHRIFDVGINFWLNLILSGVFTFWVRHYEKPIWGEGTMLGKLGIGKKLSAKGISNLRELHHAKVEQIAEGAFMKSSLLNLDSHELRAKRAESVVNVFTLQIPGHFIVIPSVTIGAKYKASIVRYFNRKHYGDEAMQSPELIARHHAIEAEERPTFLGAVMGRLGGMFVNMGLSSLIGSPNNLLNKMGAKNFKGIDPVAGRIGEHMGNVARDISPQAIEKTDRWFMRNGFDKGTSINDLGRFISQDVMYTISTSSTIYPVVNFLRKHIPGMTYKPKVETPPELKGAARLNVPQNPLVHAADALAGKMEPNTRVAPEVIIPAITPVVSPVDAAPDTAPLHLSTETPKGHVHHIKPEATITPRHEHTHSPAGA